MSDSVDAREVMRWLAEHPGKGKQTKAAKHFRLTRGRISQIARENTEAKQALDNQDRAIVANKEAIEVVKAVAARDDIMRTLEGLEESNQIFKGLVGQSINAKELDNAVSAARGLKESLEAQGKIILTLKGLIGNTLVDARSIHIHTLADLPPGAREAIENEVARKVITEAWGQLCAECRAKLSGGK